MAAKTPALVVLERAGAAHRVHEYQHDPQVAPYGLEAAEKLAVDPGRVFKTLVADVDGALVVAVVPVEAQLDLGALGKRASLADAKLAERTTGFVAGGIGGDARGLALDQPGVRAPPRRHAHVAARPHVRRCARPRRGRRRGSKHARSR